jgi:REP element-mobilizing transposase RayT
MGNGFDDGVRNTSDVEENVGGECGFLPTSCGRRKYGKWLNPKQNGYKESLMDFEQDSFFHVYTRANSPRDVLFNCQDNYRFFLDKLRHYILPIADIQGYCLVPNHYHLLIHVHPQKQLSEFWQNTQHRRSSSPFCINGLVQSQFAHFHNSYAKAFNQMFKRRGSLFQVKPKAKIIKSDTLFLIALRYVHRNPLKHRLVNVIDEWPYSSYFSYLQDDDAHFVKTELALSMFESVDDFIDFTCLDIDDYEGM